MADAVPGSKRRAHRKSRTGCLQCKERKIKVRKSFGQFPTVSSATSALNNVWMLYSNLF